MFTTVYVVGKGSVAQQCAELVQSFGVPCRFLDRGGISGAFAEKRALGADFASSPATPAAIEAILRNGAKTLVLSVNNDFLFPGPWLENSEAVVINYHNSLLPKHRGMNAEAWTIFEGDSTAGITWHLVDKGIDTGKILFQKPLPIHDDTTSISLLQAQGKEAKLLLQEHLPTLLSGRLTPLEAPSAGAGRIHYKKDVPGNGILEQTWPTRTIWNFLRAMDYGPYNALGTPAIWVSGEKYSWHGYAMLNNEEREGTLNFSHSSILINNVIALNNVYKLI